MSDITIRLARASEDDSVGVLTVAGYDADGYLTLSDGTPDRGYASWLRDGATRGRDGSLIVAADGDHLVGTVTWCPPGSPFRELATGDRHGEIRTLSVLPDGRGRGVGTALVRRCIEQGLDAGLSEIVLSSLPEMLPAHRLYGALGFVRRPELDWSPNASVDLWGFSLNLNPDGEA